MLTTLTLIGFEDMVFGSTGFSPIDLLHVSKVVRLMGKLISASSTVY